MDSKALNPKAIQALMDAIEGECDGQAIDEQQAASVLEYVIAASPCSDTAGLPSDRVGQPPMPPTQDRQPYDEDAFGTDYLEGDRDWANENADAVTWLADNHKAIREAIAALSRAPEVKPLEWQEGGSGDLFANTAFNQRYYIWPKPDGDFVASFGGFVETSADMDVAKAAAQADYERRVLSALA